MRRKKCVPLHSIMEKEENSPVYSRDVMEFVTVAVEYCAFLEQSNDKKRLQLTDTLLKILPLVYLKSAILPKYEILDADYYPEDYVTEENYDIVRQNLAYVLGEKDDYLEVFMEDMKYSDSPILTTISENLSDIYQALKNFAMNYKNAADEEMMMNALASVKNEFQYDWGLKVVNVMRALHEVRYSEQDEY